MRRGFTLIELLVSIILFSLITTFLYGGIDQVRIIRLFYTQKGEILKKHEQIRSLLYRDLIQADTMTIIQGDKDRSIVSLSGERNSLYGIASPNVIWLVMREGDSLLRLESAQNIQLPLDLKNLYSVHSDIVAIGCRTFRVYESATSRLATLKCDKEEINVETPH